MKSWNLLFDFMRHKFTTKLSKHLYYHNWEHTLHVVKMAEYIALKEGVSSEDVVLIKIASLLHDSGYLNDVNDGHEEESIKIAKEVLPNYNYNRDEIELICNMIKATKIPQQPQNIFEKIVADADLEYLGTANFKAFGDLLFKELQHYHPELNRESWDKTQIKFLQKHHFYTNYCILNRNPTKEKHLQKLLKIYS